jgi:hypothetical protein
MVSLPLIKRIVYRDYIQHALVVLTNPLLATLFILFTTLTAMIVQALPVLQSSAVLRTPYRICLHTANSTPVLLTLVEI